MSEIPAIGTSETVVVLNGPRRSSALEVFPLPYVGSRGANLPRREFLCGPAFQRKHMTLTVAPAGVGKTSLTIAEAVHIAAGKEFFAPIARPTKVWLFNGEEARDELERRIAGTIEAHHLDAELVAQNLFFNSGRVEPIILAETGSYGMEVYNERADHLIAVIRERGIKVLIVDPFVSTHAVQENNNAAIDKVSKLWAAIAERGDCAVHLVHHARKMGRSEMTAESVRGASSLVASARYVRALTKIPGAEAKKLGWQGAGDLIRIDVAKENNSSTMSRQFFSLRSVNLGNGDGIAAGDDVGVVCPFAPTATSGSISDEPVKLTIELRQQLAEIFHDRRDLRDDRQAPNWAGRVLGPLFDMDPDLDAKGLQRVLASLVRDRLLAKEDVTGRNGRKVKILVAGDRLRRRETPADQAA